MAADTDGGTYRGECVCECVCLRAHGPQGERCSVVRDGGIKEGWGGGGGGRS